LEVPTATGWKPFGVAGPAPAAAAPPAGGDLDGSERAEEELEHLEQIVARQLTAEEGFVEAKRTGSSPRVKTPTPLTTGWVPPSLVEEVSPFRATPAAEVAEVDHVAASSGEEQREASAGESAAIAAATAEAAAGAGAELRDRQQQSLSPDGVTTHRPSADRYRPVVGRSGTPEGATEPSRTRTPTQANGHEVNDPANATAGAQTPATGGAISRLMAMPLLTPHGKFDTPTAVHAAAETTSGSTPDATATEAASDAAPWPEDATPRLSPETAPQTAPAVVPATRLLVAAASADSPTALARELGLVLPAEWAAAGGSGGGGAGGAVHTTDEEYEAYLAQGWAAAASIE
jgi:hypothetical protein